MTALSMERATARAAYEETKAACYVLSVVRKYARGAASEAQLFGAIADLEKATAAYDTARKAVLAGASTLEPVEERLFQFIDSGQDAE